MSYVQSNQNGTGGSVTLSTAFSSNNGKGNLLVASTRNASGTGHAFNMTDTQNNKWYQAQSFGNGTDLVEFWYAPGCKAGANTVNYGRADGSSNNMNIVIGEWSDVSQTLVQSTYLTNIPVTTTIAYAPPVAPVFGPVLALGFICNRDADNQSFTPGASWIVRNNTSNNTFLCDAPSWQQGSSQIFTGTYSNDHWATGILIFAQATQPITKKRRNSVEAALFTGREYAYYITLERLF